MRDDRHTAARIGQPIGPAGRLGVIAALAVVVCGGIALADPAPRLGGGGAAPAAPEAAVAATAATDPVSVPIEVNLDGVSGVTLERRPDGSLVYLLRERDATRALSPDQFATLLYRDHRSRSVVNILLNITGPVGVAWVALGFLGQALFTGRMLVQWLASEKKRRSVIPVAFWWLSLCGGAMLLTYFIWRKDIVGVVGQSMGVFIYTRNLILLRRRAARAGRVWAERAGGAAGEGVLVDGAGDLVEPIAEPVVVAGSDYRKTAAYDPPGR